VIRPNSTIFYRLRITLKPKLSAPGHFPLFPFSLIILQHNYTLWLYVAFGSAKTWLMYALAERTGIGWEAEIFMFFVTGFVL